MRRRLFVVLLALAPLAAVTRLFAQAESQVPDCVEVRAEGRQNGIGFMHVVMVTNHCAVEVTCDLATDADPSPTQRLVLAPNQSGEVVTRVASPAGGVSAVARCVERGGSSAPRRRDY